jgi:regulator of protease activity HflC (stomatin/prohibitin superfamily)
MGSGRFEIQEFKPSTATVTRQLELQLEGERARRKQILDTESQVNVSEGMKRSAILKSEGHLMSLRNEITGDYESKIRRAESEKEAMRLTSEGIAHQIETVRAALGSDATGVDAMNALLKMKGIENVGKIAEGKNNSTYFLPEQDVFSKLITAGKLLTK